MCYHTSTPEHTNLSKLLPRHEVRNYPHYYHTSGFDHHFIPIETKAEPYVIQPAIWGLVLEHIDDGAQAKETANKTLNARSDNIFRLYPGYIARQRCLVWIDGFFEWRWEDAKGKTKTPYYIYMPEHKPFTFGGIYTEWPRPDTGEIMHTVSIITTPGNERMEYIHNNKKRMPLVLPEDERERWLSDIGKEEIKAMMQPLPDGILQDHPVSKIVSNFSRGVNTNVPEVQKPIDYDRQLF